MKAFFRPEAESALLGYVLSNGFNDLPLLKPEQFSREEFQILYATALDLCHKGRSPNSNTLLDHIERIPHLKRRLQELAVKQGKAGETAWRDFVICIDESVNSPEIAQTLILEISDAYKYRLQSEVAQQMQNGEISPAEAREKLGKILTETDSPLTFVDFKSLFKAGLQPEKPNVANVTDNLFLLYSGRLNEIHGEPATGKTNVALSIAQSVIRGGGHVLFLDPEDTPRGIANRLHSFGLTEDEICTYFHYLQSPTPEEINQAICWAKQNSPSLVIADGLAEFLASEGLDEDKPADNLYFFRERLRPFTECGAAVLISDHVVKNTENRGRWARGSGAKMGRYDGVSYSLELITPYSPTRSGTVRLSVAKDRNGGVGVLGAHIAEVHFVPDGLGLTEVSFKHPQVKNDFRPTAIMAKICSHLELFPDATKNDLRCLGKSQYVDMAIQTLISEGCIESEKQGQRMRFKVLKAYKEDL